MSKRKKPVKRRRRRMGAAAMSLNPTSPLVKFGAPLLGFFMPGPINGIIDKVAGSIDPKIVGVAQTGLGVLYLMSKGKKNLLLTIAAGVTAGAGAKRAMTAFGIGAIGNYGQVSVLNGYGNVTAIGYREKARLNGYAPQGTLAGYSPQGTLAGPNVMGSVGNGNGSGSDLMKDGGSSLMG